MCNVSSIIVRASESHGIAASEGRRKRAWETLSTRQIGDVIAPAIAEYARVAMRIQPCESLTSAMTDESCVDLCAKIDEPEESEDL